MSGRTPTGRKWSEYFEATKERPPHRIVLQADRHLAATGRAMDLGCGAGRSTLHLLARGWSVIAVDAQAEALEILGARAGDHPGLTLRHSRFQELILEPCDLYLAIFTLFFMPPDELAAFWARLRAAMGPGALFAGQLLGVHDDWVKESCTGLEAAAVHRMLDGMEALHLEEEDADGPMAIGGTKHWHLFHVIARMG